MAKKSMIAREAKRQVLSYKYHDKRIQLKKVIVDSNSTEEERAIAELKLQKLPRDTSKVRLRNRCNITGRPHGYYRKFGLGRNKLRESVMKGDVPGVSKASW